MKKLHLILLCFYGFSLPFEYFDPWGITSFFSITKIVGLSYALVSVIILLKSRLVSADLVKTTRPLFFLFLLVTFLSLLNAKGAVYNSWFDLSWFLCILSFFILSIDIIQYNKYLDYILISFVLSVILVVVLVNLDIGVEYSFKYSANHRDTGRLFFMGTNPNSAAMWACFASIILLYYILNRQLSLIYKLLSVLSILLFVQFITLTASRGAFLVFFITGLIFLIDSQKKLMNIKGLIIVIIGLVFLGFLYRYMLEGEVMQQRLNETYEKGGASSRIEIWKAALSTFTEYPLGIGETGWEVISREKLGEYVSTHNLFFYVLVTGGIFGIILFFNFLYKIIKYWLKTRKSRYRTLTLCLFLVVIFDFSKNGGAISQKIDYFFLALAFSIFVVQYKTSLEKLDSNLTNVENI